MKAVKQKLVSIIIPTYNCGHKLAATMNSVLSQANNLYEIIVVDGGSTDETLSVIKDYEGSLKYVSEADCGVYDALNKGIALASGKYLLFLGAGDGLKEGVLERVAALLPEDKLCFVYGDAYLVRHSLRTGGEFSSREFLIRNICQQAIFYERTIFDQLGKFDVTYKVFADWVFNMKCFADKRVRKIYLDMVVADFEGWGISDTQQDADFYRDQPRLVRKYVGLFAYLRCRGYLSRVAFYGFSQRLVGSITEAAKSSGLLGRRESRDSEE